MMYIIQSRYEYWSLHEGKKWTRWFNLHGAKFDSLELAEEALKSNKKKSSEIDKVTKLKHEFKIEQI